jgi:hypothetical protein
MDFTLGAATGIVIFAISYLSDIAAGKYFILVSGNPGWLWGALFS